MEQIKLIGTCQICGRAFVYYVTADRRPKLRRRCPYHHWKKKNAIKKAYNDAVRNKKPGELKLVGKYSRHSNVTGVIKKSHAEIARALNMKRHEVEDLERSATLKIRNNPELKKLWSSLKEVLADGCQENGLAALQGLITDEREQGMRLLEYQAGVVEFWEEHDRIVEEMEKTGRDCSSETVECLNEIQRFQQKIAEAISRL
jgi:hypothetical protein